MDNNESPLKRIVLKFSCSAVTAISQEEKCQLLIIMWSGQTLMRTFIQYTISVILVSSLALYSRVVYSVHVTWRSSVEADYSQVFCLILLHNSFILQRERCGWFDSHLLVHLGLLMC